MPAFANHLLKQRLQDYCVFQIQLSRQLNLPLLQYFKDMDEAALLQFSMATSSELLTHLAQNKATDHIIQNMERWRTNQLPQVDKYQIQAEDITLLSHVRKQTFLHFIPAYCTDTAQMLALIKEIDSFLLQSDTVSTNTYIKLLQEKIDEGAHFIEKINNTIPGAVYVFDVLTYTGVYANNNLPNVVGHEQEELNKMGPNAVPMLVHPDDIMVLQECMSKIKSVEDGKIQTVKYRVKNKEGVYHWIRNYEAVFKRTETGEVAQIIGITLNVDKEEELALALEQREQQLLEAQDIAHIGSYRWDIKNNITTGTPKLKEILEIDLNNLELFWTKIHAADREKMKEATRTAMEKGTLDCEYRYQGERGEKYLWSKGMVYYEAGAPVTMIGTVMDITERFTILQQLKHREQQYKLAETLTHIGNFEWRLDTGTITFSDEMRRIYELDETEAITLEKIESRSQPADAVRVKSLLKKSVTDLQPFDFYYNVQGPSGVQKILHVRGSVEAEEKGNAVMVKGMAQDVTEKQTLIAHLNESQHLYKQAQALVSLGNWAWNLETGKVDWSEEIYKIYEQPPTEEITYEKITSFIHPEDRDSVLQLLQESIEKGTTYDKYHRIVLKNGKIKTVHRRAEGVRNSDGKVTKVVGTTQDVTELHQTINELKENQNFIQKIANATPSIISSYNVNSGKYVFINEGIKKLLNYERQLALEKGTSFFESIIHADDLPLLQQINKEFIDRYNSNPVNDNTPVTDYIYRMQHKEGSYKWFHTYSTIFDTNSRGNIEHLLNISLDITEQVAATEKIKEQEHFINHIADASPTVLYLYNTKTGNIEYINQEIYFVLGYTVDEILEAGNRVTELLYHPEDYNLLPERKESNKKFQYQDSMMQYECRMKNKEGAWQCMLVREVVFHTNAEGEIVQILGSALDITKRKEMEKTLLQNSFQLEQSNASLEEFAYVASHDLKEPLRKISTFGDRLMSTQLEKMSDDGKVYLKKIVDASQRMQLMINDLLSISMITGDRSYQQCSLQTILEDALQTLEFKIEQKNAVIKADPLPNASIVPSQFRQLFQNLLSNSLKFVKEDVPPIITIKHTFLKPQELGNLQLTKAPKYHQLLFIDNGIGFEEEYSNKIFAIFQRLHGRSEYEGTGIGLAICKKIVEHHGGIISATGQPGKGATFTIIMPAV